MVPRMLWKAVYVNEENAEKFEALLKAFLAETAQKHNMTVDMDQDWEECE